MALAAKLQMRQSQALVMTPQLMQSIRLLQYTHTELERFIDEEIERNPLLERVTEEVSGGEDAPEAAHRPDEPSPDWLEPELEWSAEAISDKLDSTLENVFPDEPGATDRLGPDLAAQWKSNNSGKQPPSEGFDLDAYIASGEFGVTVGKPVRLEVLFERHAAADLQLLLLPLALDGN